MIESMTELHDMDNPLNGSESFLFDPDEFKKSNPDPDIKDFELGVDYMRDLVITGVNIRACFRE